MIRDIKIGDQTVTMKATAMLGYRYKNCFGKDIYKEMRKNISESDEGSDQDVPMDFLIEVAYIMAMTGANKAGSASPVGFVEWVDGFEFIDLMMASSEISDLFMASRAISSESKKKKGQ